MHSTAIIVKKKDITPYEARSLVGELLVSREVSDWFDENSEIIFNDGNTESSISDFLGNNKIDNLDKFPKPFFVVEYDDSDKDDIWIDDLIIPSGFWEYYDFQEERNLLLNIQSAAYSKTINKILNELGDSYDICLLDYHH